MKKNKSFVSVITLLIVSVFIVSGLAYSIRILNVPQNQLPAQLITYFGPNDLTPAKLAPTPTFCLVGGDPSITVLSPNGGEIDTADKPFQIKWTSCNVPSTSMVTVSIVYNGSTPIPYINPTSQNSGLYNNYIVSNSRINTEGWKYGLNYKIKISLLNNPAVSDMSDNWFTISNPNQKVFLLGGGIYTNITSNGYSALGSNDVWSSNGDLSSWSLISPNIGSGAGSKWFPGDTCSVILNNKIYLMSPSWDDTSFDTWSSSDGITWKGESSFTTPVKHHLVCTVFNNEIWLSNGTSLQHSKDGITWTKIDSNNIVLPKQLVTPDYFAIHSFQGKLWLIVSGQYYSNWWYQYSDVWSSSDGITWTEINNAPWKIRNNFASTVFNNKMWILGGWNGNTLKDVWSSSDGINWVQVTKQANWVSDMTNMSNPLIYNGKIWFLGYNWNSKLNEIWSSSDGINWSQTTTIAPIWQPRYNQSIIVK